MRSYTKGKLKNYFHILGLDVGASDVEIRSAYRAKAKQYHPDVNSDEAARHHFIEVQQAYSFLINPAQRRNYEVLLSEEKLSRSELDRRELIYKLWVEHQLRKARTRGAMESVHNDDYTSPFSRKLWKGINVFYNITFLFVFAFIVIMPMVSYVNQLEKPISQQNPFGYFLIPTIVGCVFITFGYYYWFILKTDHD